MTDARDSCKKCGGHLRKNVYGASDMCPECENITKGHPANVVELRKLLAKATPGPWEVHDPGLTDLIEIRGCPDGDCEGYTWPLVAKINDNSDMEANARLIFAAVNALPALLDEIERLREETER